jgi:hypothetical protein
MKQLIARIWAMYRKDTRVRHFVGGFAATAAAIAVLQFGSDIELQTKAWFTHPLVINLIGGLFGTAYRWAQTQLELLIVRLRST